MTARATPMWIAALVFLIPSLILGGCAKGRSLDYAATDEETLFWKANYDFMRGEYEDARERLRLFVTQFPDSLLVPEARLGIARTYFEEKEYEQARVTYERFITLHPRNERTDEAMYFIGLSYYQQMEKVDRDQTPTQRAVVSFRRLIKEVPRTPYKEDAIAKIITCRRQLAEREISVGLFYLKRDKYKAAKGRFQRVLDYYDGIGYEPKALYYLAEAYEGLEEKDKAQEAYRQLLERYPDSLWAAEAGDHLGIKVVVQPDKAREQSPEESSGGIWGFFEESWDEIKSTFEHSLKTPATP
ncbi:MAG: outer membrane protein assembly factor BamD [Candidatus Methylomirabilales bacterium]